jgi:acetylornithine deacetylase/succinyl-diaminopimelate desuccinylase-like protein
VRSLSFPRLSSTPGEEKAGNYIIDQLKRYGLEPKIQSFSFSAFPYAVVLRATVLFQAFLLLFSIIQSGERPFLAALLALFLLGFTLMSTRWGSLFEAAYDMGPKKKSRNIYVRIAGNEPHSNLVFLAHYDSKSQTIPIAARVLFYLLFYFGAILLAGLILVLLALGHGDVVREKLVGAGVIVSLCSLPILLNFTGNASPGALDNASGAAIVLELARCLSGRVPKGLDITFLFTGAEEMGLAGAVKFIQELGGTYDGRKCFCLSYDGAGAEGKLRFTTRYGMPPVRTSGELRDLAITFCESQGIECHETFLPVGAGLEQTPLSYHGFDVITVHSGGLGRPLLAVHSRGDVPENLDLASIEKCGKLGEAVAYLLAERKKRA